MRFDQQAVSNWAATASTEALLDRVTVYRNDMEPHAVKIFERELAKRGIKSEKIANHGEMQQETALRSLDGHAVKCSQCDRPAVGYGWGWLKVFRRKIPFFPIQMPFCQEHQSGMR